MVHPNPKCPQKLIAIHELRYGSSAIWSIGTINTDIMIQILYVTNHWCSVSQTKAGPACFPFRQEHHICNYESHEVEHSHIGSSQTCACPLPTPGMRVRVEYPITSILTLISDSVVQTWKIQILDIEDFLIAIHFFRPSVCSRPSVCGRPSVCSSCSHFKI
jgi:hypothetical protein